MFADAWENAARHTRHVVTCARYADGFVSVGGATFFLLGPTGWVITAGHVFDEPRRATSGQPILTERWWGVDGVTESDVHVYEDVDLAICRLERRVADHPAPRFRRAESQRLGTSLLTLGYPFEKCSATYDTSAGEFRFEFVCPLRGRARAHESCANSRGRRRIMKLSCQGSTRGLYGVQGMLARIIDAGKGGAGYPRRYLETSSPSRIGQSGGPTVDATGAVWGIQVRTHHEVLGYEVPIRRRHKVVTEHQVSNTAIGVQTSTLEMLLERHGIDVDWVD